MQENNNNACIEQPSHLLSARNIRKAYGGVNALSDVSFELAPGEIHALCGENGAGKSTFIKVLGGLVKPDDGLVSIQGQPLKLGQRTDPRLISIVHQELAIVPTLSVLDNILLGGPDQHQIYRRGEYRESVRSHLDAVGLSHIPLDIKACNLSLAECQLVEIARGLSRKAKILLLDEPTATLSDAEILRVFDVARRLRDLGTSMIFVSHRLDEVFALTDRVTVFRNGKHVLTQTTATLTTSDVVRAMIGRDLSRGQCPEKSQVPQGRSRLSVRSLSIPAKLQEVSFDVAPGEILAVVGQLGSGAERVVQALAGLEGPLPHPVELDGEKISISSIKTALNAGIAYVAEDRAEKGVFLEASIASNITCSVMARFSRAGVLQRAPERSEALRLAKLFTIDSKRLDHDVSTLSGGNQQKVSLAKAVALAPRLLLLNEPTRGVDIGARAEIYETLKNMAAQGLSIIFYSTDLEEILDFASTVMTVFKGKMIRCVPRDEIDGDIILHDIVAGRGESADIAVAQTAHISGEVSYV